MLMALIIRELRLLHAGRARLLPLLAYPFLLLTLGALALDLPRQGGEVRAALLLIAGALLPLGLASQAWREDVMCGALDQLRLAGALLPAVAARFLVWLLALLLPLTLLLALVGGLVVGIAPGTILPPLLLALPSLTGLLLLVAALAPSGTEGGALPALLLLPLALPLMALMALAVGAEAALAHAALWWLAALAALSCGLLPPAIAGALKTRLQQ